jgi:hypothetical protein
VSSWRKPLATALIVELIGLAGFFIAAVIDFSADLIVPAFTLRWEWTTALLGFFRWIPALQFLGLALALGGSKDDSEATIRHMILPAVMLSVLFSALVLIAQPELSASRSSMLAASGIFTSSLEKSRSALEAGDFAQSRAQLEACRAISPRDARVEVLAERLGYAVVKAGKTAAAVAAPAEPVPLDPKTARDYYLKALGYSEAGDHLTAHWYAQRAASLDPSHVDAKRLAAKSWEALLARGAGDPENARFYARKLEGYGLLRAGAAVDAYGIWRELAVEHGSDPDVKRYLAESLAEVERTAFFKDEYDQSLGGEVLDPVFLVLPSQGGSTRILAAAAASFAGESVYFRELEYLEASGGGGPPRALVRAPYGKLSGGRLFLVCAAREPGGAVYRPRWEKGPAAAPSNTLDVDLPTDVAHRVLSAREDPASLGLVAAWRVAAEASSRGVDPEPILRDLARRTGAPFALFAAGLLGAIAGLRFRRREFSTRRDAKKPDRRLYLLAPFMAAAGIPAYILAERIGGLIAAWSAAALDGYAAVWAAAGLRVVLLAAAILVIGGTREDRGRAEAE